MTPLPDPLRAVIDRIAALVARPQHRERVYRAERQRRLDVAALLESKGK